MSKKSVAIQMLRRWSVSRLSRILMGVVIAGFVLAVGGNAQTTTKTGTDQMTPSNLAVGSPAGSYALSGFDNVNLFNGNLNFRLPLLSVGGRGSAGFTMMLALNTKSWHVRRVSTIVNNEETITYLPSPNTWQPRQVGYGPGVMIARKSGEGTFHPAVFPCNNPLQRTYEKTITRLTFTGSDGTEFEFLDQLTMGRPYTTTSADCTNPTGGFSRGRVWVTTKGEAATFISDGAISDRNVVPASGTFFDVPSGYLFLRDGTRYRIDAGLVSWLQDRNGNRITFSYDANSRVSLIIDSLNRQISVTYDDSAADDCTTHYDVITFRGFGGTTRTIQVGHNCLSSALISGQTIKSYHDLFPELNGDTRSSFGPKVITSLFLPDGVRRYQFFYDSYGEVARVVLPTGGAYEYDYTSPASGVGFDNVTGIDYEIYRRVVARRVMPDGTSVEGRTSYTPTTGMTGSATVDHWDSGTVRLGHEEHTFLTDGTPGQLSTRFGVILYSSPFDGMEGYVDAMDTNGTTALTQEANSYGYDLAPWTENGFQLQINPRLTDTLTKLLDVSPALVSKRHTDYDAYNNPTNVEEYDFGSGSAGPLIRRSTASYVTTNGGVSYATVNPNTTNPDPASTVHLRSLPSQQSVFDGPTGAEKARTIYEYDNYNQTPPTDNFHAALTSRSSITGLDSAWNTTYYARGNVTKTTSAVSFDGSGNVTASVSGYAQYDIAGNVVKAIDPRSTTTNIIATAFDFSDRYGAPDDEARGNTQAPPELGVLHTYAFPALMTNPLGHTSYAQFDYYLGKPVNAEDANGIVSSARYDDALDRPTGVDVGIFSGSQLQRHTSFVYGDSSHLITTQSDQTTLNDGVLTSTVLYDGLGRTTETRTSAPEGTIYTTQQYDAMGRLKRSYNPYRTTSDATYGYADTSYDALGQVKSVTTSDNAVVTTTYSGNTTTVTDQAGKKRRSVADGLGRLIRVDEPDAAGNLDNTANPPLPLQPTSYVYDALGNLIQVNQGSQQRLFTYDSLSRLKTARNPEQVNTSSQMVETTYDYDAASNLLSRSGPNSGSSVSFTYDALNRVKTKTLSSGGVWDYSYDTAGIPNAKGRLVSVVLHGSTDGTYYDSYDAAGRVTASRQVTTAGTANSYTMSYQYDLAGNVTQETYPSGKVFVTEYDSAGRIAGVKRGTSYYAGASPTDATNRIQYSAHGGIGALRLGNGKWEHTVFNSRLQPKEIGLGAINGASDLLKLEYTYSNANPSIHDNNGNVLTQKITAPNTGGGTLVLTQNYNYDALNRLSIAEEFSGAASQWRQTYDIDRWGNRAVRNTSYILPQNINLTPMSTGPTDFTAFNQSTNRIAVGGFDYDTAGNLKADPTTGANAMLYDAENRQTSYTKAGVTTSYSYDGDGHRVKKIDNDGTTVFVYNAGGQLIAEYTSGPPTGSGTSYLTSDHLGSTRVVMKSDGTVARHDYLPFGEEIPSTVGSRSSVAGYGAADTTRQKFTQKERDNESGLDYFLARYYSSAQGRFTSVDAGRLNKRHLANPQKWNRYAYTINNPLKYIDPDGLEELIVIVNTFIPQKSTGPFKGDGRNAGENGTYRTHQRIVIETDPSKNGGNPLVGKPERDTGVSKGILPQGTTNPSFGGVVYVPKEDKASGNSLGVDVTRNEGGVVNIHAHGNENNPLVPSPGITYNFDIKVNSEGPQGTAEVTVTGKHDRFPGYEIIVQRPEAANNTPQVVYDFDPRKNGNTPMSLFPFTPKEYPNKTTPIPPKPE